MLVDEGIRSPVRVVWVDEAGTREVSNYSGRSKSEKSRYFFLLLLVHRQPDRSSAPTKNPVRCQAVIPLGQ